MFDPVLARDPYPAYAKLRQGPDVAHDAARDCWIVHRYADVRGVLRDTESFSSVNASFEHTLLGADGERHNRVRRALGPSFSPVGAGRLRDAVVQQVTRRLDAMAVRGTGDIVADLAIPLPQTIVGQLLGVPDSTTARLQTWADALLNTTHSAATAQQQLESCRRVLAEHFTDFRAEGLALAVRAFEAEPKGLTLDQRVDLGLLLIIAGLGTTTSLIGSAIQVLLAQPRLRRRLKQEPDLVAPFIEEVLRHRSPVQRVWRRTTRETSLAGQAIPAGANLLVLIGAANRDPLKFADAGRFRPFRQPNDHLGFAIGAHTCLGLWLARTETTLAIQGLLQRFSAIEPAGPADEMGHLGNLAVFGPARLDIAVHA